MEKLELPILKIIRTKTWGFLFSADVLKKLAICSTILGGGIQVFYLCSLSPVYLRFFSVTQMASDSLVIAINIFTFLITPFLIMSTLLSIRASLHADGLVFTITLIIAAFIAMHIGKFQHGDPNVIFSFLVWSLASILLVVFLNVLIKIPYEKHLGKFLEKYGKEGIENVFSLTASILLLIFVIVIFTSYLAIKNNSNALKHHMFSTLVMSDNFVNKNNICKNGSNEKCNIKYFNDKYVFLEREKEKIEILKFDTFFNKPNQ